MFLCIKSIFSALLGSNLLLLLFKILLESGGYIPEGNITFNEYKIDPACLRIPNPRQVCWDNHKFTAPHKGML